MTVTQTLVQNVSLPDFALQQKPADLKHVRKTNKREQTKVEQNGNKPSTLKQTAKLGLVKNRSCVQIGLRRRTRPGIPSAVVAESSDKILLYLGKLAFF